MSIFLGAIVGAGMGFLWYNAYPAQVFMGDVGSLSLGGILGTAALITKTRDSVIGGWRYLFHGGCVCHPAGWIL